MSIVSEQVSGFDHPLRHKDSLKDLINAQLKNEEIFPADLINKYTPQNSSESTKSYPSESQKSSAGDPRSLTDSLAESTRIPSRKVLAEKTKDDNKTSFSVPLSRAESKAVNKLELSIPTSPANNSRQSPSARQLSKKSLNTVISDESISPEKKFHLKKNLNIPNLKLGKVETQKNLTMADRTNSLSAIGFRSERIDRTPKDVENQPIPKKIVKDKSDTGINFFFYKNFNKFIQNLYIQDEQQLQKSKENLKKLEKANSSVTTQNPYKKEMESVNRKPISLKKNPGISSSQNLAANGSQPLVAALKRSDTGKKYLTIDDEKGVVQRPKEEMINNYMRESASSLKSSTKNLKTATNCTSTKLEFGKLKLEKPDIKMFLTPRELKK